MPDKRGAWPRRRRRGLTAAVGERLGVPVGVAVPIQSQHPAWVLSVGAAELAALLALVVTAAPAALLALVGLSVVLVVLAVVNRRRVLAITSGGVLLLTASSTGRPLDVLGPAPDGLVLPQPSGLAARIAMGGGDWWVDRSAFARLRLAREQLGGAP